MPEGHVIVLANTTMKKLRIIKWCEHSQFWWKLHLGIGEVSQSVVESSSGSMISFNGYHYQYI